MFTILTYKIIACIERATVLQADITRIMREYKTGEGVPRCFDKQMSGSSLEAKTFLRSFKTLNSNSSTSAKFTVQNPDL